MIDLGTWAGEQYRIGAEDQGETPSDDQATQPEGIMPGQRNRKIVH
jgi:endogenous inhibitor of DNA gyrase (YacG/DUF329 family)